MYYKLTDPKGQTYGFTQWGPGIRHIAVGSEHKFCTADLIHFYDDPHLAEIFNPMHGRFGYGKRMWEIAVEGQVYSDHGTKFGAKAVTTICEVNVPIVTTKQRVEFAILCAQTAFSGKSVKWDIRAAAKRTVTSPVSMATFMEFIVAERELDLKALIRKVVEK